MSSDRKWTLGFLLVFALIAAGLAFFQVRDNAAIDRCHSIGGETYDQGLHCVIGGKTVSTR